MTIRVYADTSVYGGCFDPEFARASNAFFDGVRESRFVLVTSALVAQEIAGAPARVRALFDEFAAMAISVEVSAAAEGLQQAYLAAGAALPRSHVDALHVAVAAVSGSRWW